MKIDLTAASVGSSQAPTAIVDKSPSDSNKEIQTVPHTVLSLLEEVGILTGHTPKIVLADRGYRSVQPPSGTRLLISHTPRLPPRLRKLLQRCQVGEPMIGHMKADGLLEPRRVSRRPVGLSQTGLV